MKSPMDSYVEFILQAIPQEERVKTAEKYMLINLKDALKSLGMAKALNNKATALPPTVQSTINQAIDEFNNKIADAALEILKFELPDML